ncbi:hypothetical protein [Pseudolysinimonas sp.]|uniref:hypothetical protein n=1 Tax=Pseudolysinimonas sp. TaxID=2680009 RepID=UPI003783060F
MPKTVTPKTSSPIAPEPAAKKPWWRHTWAVVSAAVGVIGAITGVISIVPFVFRDATTLDSLVVSVESVESDFAPTFAVPLTAAWAQFPVSASACDAAQLAWLDSNGTVLEERFLVSVANSAKEGAMMSLKDFRGDGEVVPAPPETVAVTCDQTGGGTSNLRAASLDPASGRTAVYVQPDPTLPDNPLVFNLAPGENGQFAITLRSSADFRGSIVFVEALGTELREVTLPIGDVDLPGTAPIRFTVEGGSLSCVAVENCTPSDVLAQLRIAAGLT